MSRAAGARVVFNHYPLLGRNIAKAVHAACLATAFAIENDVKSVRFYQTYPETPNYRRTGNLGRSYHVRDRTVAGGFVRVEVGNDVRVAPYAIFVEYGTSKMPAKPHLTPASVAQQEPHAMRIVAAIRGVGVRSGGMGPVTAR